ncbi:hypothetical protein DRN97_10170 [Methanosarcinales archaeon]|nr:MAG: hypothetical protein DRN97_10170 [Methanosarcinales archaeon]
MGTEMDDLVLVHRTKPREIYYLRAKPCTAKDPTIHQLKSRLAFGHHAKKARNKNIESDLPPAAEQVKKLRGKKFGRTRKLRKWEELLLKEARKEGREEWEEIILGKPNVEVRDRSWMEVLLGRR